MAKNAPYPRHVSEAAIQNDPDSGHFLTPVPSPVPGGRTNHGSLDIRIDPDGVWHYQGSPINRKEMVCLFASVLVRDSVGNYWMVTPSEMGQIQVDDAPFIAVEMFVAGEGRAQTVSFRTNVDEIVTVDSDHPITVAIDPATGEPSPYVSVRSGIQARLSRAVYYDLAALAVSEAVADTHDLGIWSDGSFFRLGSMDDDG
ncbi:MAG: DUF1285 domain-containing protein [Rhodospirillales bacterium]|nr:MAG: DUF1285 domain-containing protein [Rhodospirillales bacterium]